MISSLLTWQCSQPASLLVRLKSTAKSKMATVTSTPFGSTDGADCHLFTIKNKNGMSISFTNYGATLTSVKVPSKTSAKAEEVTLVPGYPAPTLDALVKVCATLHCAVARLWPERLLTCYALQNNGPYQGVTVGRVANVSATHALPARFPRAARAWRAEPASLLLACSASRAASSAWTARTTRWR